MSRRPHTPEFSGDGTTLLNTPVAPAWSPITPVGQASTSNTRGSTDHLEPDIYDQSLDSDSDDSDEEMPTDITFTGKASELSGVLAHCKVTFLAKSTKYSKDEVKSAYFATLFRGSALEWLGTKLEDDTAALANWDQFQNTIKNHFGISTATKERIAEQAIHRLKQTGSAQKYANDFDSIAEELGISDDVKSNFFRPGLKADVARALVGRDTSTWDRLRRAAIEIDEELYSLRQRNRRKAPRLAGGGKQKDGKGGN
jgi:hypothetical protein